MVTTPEAGVRLPDKPTLNRPVSSSNTKRQVWVPACAEEPGQSKRSPGHTGVTVRWAAGRTGHTAHLLERRSWQGASTCSEFKAATAQTRPPGET